VSPLELLLALGLIAAVGMVALNLGSIATELNRANRLTQERIVITREAQR
jgi:hypothetical protein